MADATIARGGVYEIVNLVDGKLYIGSTVSFRKRFAEHLRKLSRGNHENDRLQKAYNKHGGENFSIRVVEHCADGRLEREQFWIDATRSAIRGYGYNLSPTAGSPSGYKHGDEARAKMRAAHVGRAPISDETRRRLSQSLRGLKRTPEQVNRHRESLTGYKHTPEARENMRLSRLGKKQSPELVAKRSAAHIGMKRSEEARKRMSEAAKKRWSKVANQ